MLIDAVTGDVVTGDVVTGDAVTGTARVVAPGFLQANLSAVRYLLLEQAFRRCAVPQPSEPCYHC
ncbi:MAG: hypothetical protein HC800_16290 [Phormidesmis sp. RL_2_1]|nr:hypothetical protein [Phormidesmis sp. RL_2_1]